MRSVVKASPYSFASQRRTSLLRECANSRPAFCLPGEVLGILLPTIDSQRPFVEQLLTLNWSRVLGIVIRTSNTAAEDASIIAFVTRC